MFRDTPPRQPALLIALGMLGLLLIPAPASAQTANRTIEIVLTDDGANGPYYFLLANNTQHNPVITVNPGETVTFRARNTGATVHNFHIMGTLNKATRLLNAGQMDNLTVTFPNEDTTIAYQCDPHVGLGMKGDIKVGKGKEDEDNGGGGERTPGFEPFVLIGAAAIAVALLRRREG